MRHSASNVTIGNVTRDGVFYETRYAMTVGNPSESVPRFSATYIGAMRGYNVSGPRPIRDVDDDVRIDFMFDRTEPRIDVSFMNITSASRSSMSWSDLPVAANGTFKTGEIHGSFFGPPHEEIAGTFSTDGIIGSFATRRRAEVPKR